MQEDLLIIGNVGRDKTFILEDIKVMVFDALSYFCLKAVIKSNVLCTSHFSLLKMFILNVKIKILFQL